MYSSTLSLTSLLRGSGWSTPLPCLFLPGKGPVPFVYEAGLAPGPVWKCVENIAITGNRSPGRRSRYNVRSINDVVPSFARYVLALFGTSYIGIR